MTFFELMERFPTENHVIEYFAESRYGKTVSCNHCGERVRISRKTGERASMFQCNACNNSFSIFTGTIFEKTRTDLRKWVFAINQLAVSGKKGVSACQMQREIGVTYKTAWRMLRQIRTAMSNRANQELFASVTEIDECYLGGKPRKGTPSKRGRGTRKVPVVGVLDRESGKVFAHAVMPQADGKTLTGKQLLHVIDKYASKDATIITDEFSGYRILDRIGRRHLTVNHREHYVDPQNPMIHVNGTENFWSLVKRMHFGTYHKMGIGYIDLYLGAEAFRYSMRNDMDQIFDAVMRQAVIG